MTSVPVARRRWTGFGWGWPGALAIAVLNALTFMIMDLMFVHTAGGQRVDEQLFHLVTGLTPPLMAPPLAFFARALYIPLLATAALVVGLAALHRRRWGDLTIALLLVTASAAVSPMLRDTFLSRPRFTVETFPENSYPSTHTSLAVALVVAVVLLWPRPEPRRLRMVAGVVVLAVMVGNVLSQAHRPSDVLGSALLVSGLFWALRATRAFLRDNRAWPHGS